MLLTTFLTVLFFSATLCKPFDGSPKAGCGYDSCHKTYLDKLNVHLVSHSHDDLGWLKTVDQYFYGNNIKQHKGVRGVQNILDTVVQSLLDNPDRRFIQVETAFFARWWEQQSNEIKDIVKSLVNNGQLEMVSGGWSMNDEATTNYQSIIDQFTLGLRYLKDALGDCAIPRVGWQIDPFGHTHAMATIFAELGFDGLFFTRLDYREIEVRNKNKTSEFIWRGNSELGDVTDIFTSLIYRFYNAPDYFCWDVQCNDLPMVDDKDSFDYNVDKRVENFTAYINEQAKNYGTNNILITMGGDFTYQAAHMYYANIDKLITGFKEFQPDINIIYSTPSCYIKAVNDEAVSKQMKFTLKTDDFIPYAPDKHTYWTGFYTSRPTLKRLERLGNNLLQVAKQLVVQANAYKKDFVSDLAELKNVMGIIQHHDAITGTEKEHVADDYTFLLTRAIKNAEEHVHTMIFDLLKMAKDQESDSPLLNSCLLSNVTRCTQSQLKQFTVAVYNPSSQVTSHYVRLPVVSNNYTVRRLTGSDVDSEILPSIDTFDDLPGSKSLYDLTFRAEDIPPLGIKYYYIVKNDEETNKPNMVKPTTRDHIIGTNVTGFILDDNGFLETVMINGSSMPIKQEFLYYKSSNGTNDKPENRASGAYVFRPAVSEAVPISTKVEVEVFRGELFDEAQQKFNDWLKQVIRVYKLENYIEFDWVIGPVDYIDKLGIEVVTRFSTPEMNNEDIFYTDTNGRELVKRKRNYRESFEYTNEEPVSGNYYPVTSRIVLRDESIRRDLVIHSDRSQGGSSLASGQVELMIHRRLMNDDKFGVDEVLNEREFNRPIRVRGQHYLYYGDFDFSAVQQHKLSQLTTLAPWIFVGDATEEQYSINNLMKKMVYEFSGIRNPLPENVRILTLEQLSNVTLLLRLEHLYAPTEHSTLSNPVTIDLKELLTLYNVISFEETTLGANQNKSDNKKLKWSTTASIALPNPALRDEESTITLNPLEIKTYILQVEAIEIRTYTGASSVGSVPHILLIVVFAFFLLY